MSYAILVQKPHKKWQLEDRQWQKWTLLKSFPDKYGGVKYMIMNLSGPGLNQFVEFDDRRQSNLAWVSLVYLINFSSELFTLLVR